MISHLFPTYNKMIRSVIEDIQGDIYIVHLIKENRCSCLHAGSSEPDPNCPKCLGTGYRIKIKRAKAVIQDSNLVSTVRSNTESIITKDCYLLDKYEIAIDDIIVTDQYTLLINEIKECRSKDNEVIYRRCFSIDKKYYNESFYRNFNKLIGKG